MSPVREVTVGTEKVPIPEFNGIRALEAWRILQEISTLIPDLAEKREAFVEDYASKHFDELDRGQAKLRFPPYPLISDDGEPVLGDNGRAVMVPSRIDSLTDEDWTHMSHVLKVRRYPTDREVGVAIMPEILLRARVPAQKLLGLIITTNDDALEALDRGDTTELDDVIIKRGRNILHRASVSQLIELTVVAVEAASEDVREAIKDLGDRMGNALGAFGFNLAVPDAPSTEIPSSASGSTSSNDSPPSTAGRSEPSSQPAGAPS